jgi:hypothetical protein
VRYSVLLRPKRIEIISEVGAGTVFASFYEDLWGHRTGRAIAVSFSSYRNGEPCLLLYVLIRGFVLTEGFEVLDWYAG